VKQHLGRQSGVQSVEVSLIDGKVEVTPKEDGQIDPRQLLKAVYDSGVSVAEMDVTARGKVVKDASGALALDIVPNQSFNIEPNDVSRELESLTAQRTAVTVRGQLYKKPAGKKKQKPDASVPLRLLILEVQKRE
jgi:hypothetical protein